MLRVEEEAMNRIEFDFLEGGRGRLLTDVRGVATAELKSRVDRAS